MIDIGQYLLKLFENFVGVRVFLNHGLVDHPAYTSGARSAKYLTTKYLTTILRLSYDNDKVIRSTYDGRLIYKTSYEGRKVFVRHDSLAKS